MGRPLGDPFCYRDERTVKAERALHRKIRPERLRELTGVAVDADQYAVSALCGRVAGAARGAAVDESAGVCFVAVGWGAGGGVYECDAYASWWSFISGSGAGRFSARRIGFGQCAEAGAAGDGGGAAEGPLAELPALRDTVLIAPACHDTASAIAGIPATGNDWAYISSGTWSLVGTLLEQPRNGAAAAEENFTNLGAVGGQDLLSQECEWDVADTAVY